MTTREYLCRPERFREEVERKLWRIDTLRRLSARLTSRPQDVRVQSSPDPARMQALLSEAMDEEARVRLLDEARIQAFIDTALFISRLPDPQMTKLLELRYLENCSWTEIAMRTGYSKTQVFRCHRLALALLPPPPEEPVMPDDPAFA